MIRLVFRCFWVFTLIVFIVCLGRVQPVGTLIGVGWFLHVSGFTRLIAARLAGKKLR